MSAGWMQAFGILGLFVAGVLVIALCRTPDGADDHDLSDHHKPLRYDDGWPDWDGREPMPALREPAVPRWHWVEEDRQIAEEMLPAGVEVLPPWEPVEIGVRLDWAEAENERLARLLAEMRPPAVARPAPPDLDLTGVPWTPPYADLTVAQARRRYGDSTDDIAHRWLVEAGREARMEMAR